MTKRKAPPKIATLSATGIPLLMLLGALYGSTVGATDIPTPCPDELGQQTDTPLHALLDNDSVTSPSIRTVGTSEATAPAAVADAAAKPDPDARQEFSDADKSTLRDAALPDISARLPGVSANDLPRFRRHMFRTDI